MIEKVEQKDPRFKNLEKKVGVFVFIVIVMLTAIFFFMGKERGIFTKKYAIFFNVDSGSGFMEGMPVKLPYMALIDTVPLTFISPPWQSAHVFLLKCTLFWNSFTCLE